MAGDNFEVKSTLKADVGNFVSGMGKAGSSAKKMGRDVASTKGDLDKTNKAAKDLHQTVSKQVTAKPKLDNKGFLRGAQQVHKSHKDMQTEAKKGETFKPKADVRGFIRDMNEAKEAVSSVGQAIGSIHQKSQQIDAKLSQTGKVVGGVGFSIEAAMVANTKTAADFEAKMNNVYTIVDRNAKGAGSFSKELLDMSTKYPVAAKDLADGLYDLSSSGIAADKVVGALEVSTMAASAGMTDSSTTARALAASLNAYGKDASQAANMSDIMFQTVNLGVLTFEELAQNMGQWVGMASAAGVGFDDASAALAGMTLAGIPAAEASTALARSMQAFVKPSETMTSIVKDLGYETPLMMIKTLGLKGSIDKLNETTGGSPELLAKVFQEVTALNGVMALGTSGGKNYQRVYDSITDTHKTQGSTARAYAEQQKGLNNQIEKLKNSFTKLRIEMGQRMIPIAKLFVGMLTNMIETFDRLPGPIKGILTYGTALVGLLIMIGGYFIATKLRGFLFEKALTKINQGMSHTVTRQTALKNSGVGLSGSFTKLAAKIGGGLPVLGKHITAVNNANVAKRKLALSNAKLLHTDREYIPVATSLTGVLLKSMQNHTKADGIIGKRVRTMNKFRNASILTKGAIAGVGIFALQAAMKILSYGDALDRAGKDAKEAAESRFTGMSGFNDIEELQKGLKDLGKDVDEFSDPSRASNISQFWDGFSAAPKFLIGKETVWEEMNRQDATNEVFAEKEKQYKNLTANVKELGAANKMSKAQVLALADASGIDLTKGLVTAGDIGSKSGKKIQVAFTDAKHQADNGAMASKQLTENLRAADSAAEGLSESVELTGTAKTLQGALQSIGSGSGAMADLLANKTEMVRAANQKLVDEGLRTEGRMKINMENVKLTLRDTIGAYMKANEDMRKWKADLLVVSGRAGEDVAADLAAMGTDGVELVHQMATGTEDEVTLMAAAVRENSRLAGDNAATELEAGLLIAAQKGKMGAAATRQAIAKELGLLDTDVERISKNYGISLADGINPVLDALGRPMISTGYGDARSGKTSLGPDAPPGMTNTESHADGGTPGETLPRRAMFSKGKTLVQWAEPETQGEWFIPANKDKRGRTENVLADAAHHFGYRLQKFADGGFLNAASIPQPPKGPGGGIMKAGAESYFRGAHDKVTKWMDEIGSFMTSGGGGGASATGLNPKFLMQYNMYNRALGNILSITSGWRSRARQEQLYREKGGYSASHAGAARPGTSKHEQGLAIDHSPHSTAAMRATAAKFGLRYPMGNEPWHVQPVWAANGGFLKNAMMKVFDSGGTLQPGMNQVYNATGAAEKLVRADGVGASHNIDVSFDLRGANIQGVEDLEAMLDDGANRLVQQLTTVLRKV